jgi:hypothetical protein
VAVALFLGFAAAAHAAPGENVADPKPGAAWIEKIGARFNEELAQGRHQELFTEYRKTD